MCFLAFVSVRLAQLPLVLLRWVLGFCRCATIDTARQETAGDHDDKRRQVDEPEKPLSPAAQNEAPVLNPVSFDLEARHDEIAADVPLGVSARVEQSFFCFFRRSVEERVEGILPSPLRLFVKMAVLSFRACSFQGSLHVPLLV